MAPRFIRLVLAALVACSAVAAPAVAETVWSGLVMANNVPEPAATPRELKRFEETLKQLFGYNQFQIIGQSRKSLSTGEDRWSASSRYFSLQVTSQREAAATHRLNLQLFQEQNLLLETEAKLTKRSPLIIRGPQVGDGQLVLVLVME